MNQHLDREESVFFPSSPLLHIINSFEKHINLYIYTLKEIIEYTGFSIEIYKDSVEDMTYLINEICPVMCCASIMADYKVQLEVYRLTCGLNLIRSCLKVIKSFRYAYRSNKKKKHFINCVHFHSYIVSQYMRDPCISKRVCKINDAVYVLCKKIAKKHRISHELFL
jgi:hypothetical protein